MLSIKICHYSCPICPYIKSYESWTTKFHCRLIRPLTSRFRTSFSSVFTFKQQRFPWFRITFPDYEGSFGGTTIFFHKFNCQVSIFKHLSVIQLEVFLRVLVSLQNGIFFTFIRLIYWMIIEIFIHVHVVVLACLWNKIFLTSWSHTYRKIVFIFVNVRTLKGGKLDTRK